VLKINNMSPVEYCVFRFGGVRKLAHMIGRNPSSISKWKLPRERGGCGGKIPRVAAEKILEVARENRIDIRPSDLFNGRGAKK